MDYELSIVSKSKKDNGEVFQAFEVEDESIIGVRKNEPFEIVFKNKTGSAVQVRLSLDGTDILTGKPATTSPQGKMWFVNAYGTLKLSAWPETDESGSRFVFTDPESGVSVNTHGNTRGVGLIAAAVYVDYWNSMYSPVTITSFPYKYRGQSGNIQTLYGNSGNTILRGNTMARGSSMKGSALNSLTNVDESHIGEATMDWCASDSSTDASVNFAADMSVGAGEQIDQELVKVAGLNKPVLDEILQLRYMSWTKLRGVLRKFHGQKTKASKKVSTAFSGDKKNIDLSNVPKVRSTAPPMERFVS